VLSYSIHSRFLLARLVVPFCSPSVLVALCPGPGPVPVPVPRAVAVFLLPYYTYSLLMNPAQPPVPPGDLALGRQLPPTLLLELTHSARTAVPRERHRQGPGLPYQEGQWGGVGAAGEPGVAEDAGASRQGQEPGIRPLLPPTDPFKTVLYKSVRHQM